MFERFTKDARRVVVAATAVADELDHARVTPDHLLVALCRHGGIATAVLRGYGIDEAAVRAALTGAAEPAGLSADELSALRRLGIDAEEVVRRVEESFGAGAMRPDRPARRLGLFGGQVRFTAEAKRVLHGALRETIAQRHHFIGSEHILLTLVDERLSPAVADLLRQRGVRYAEVRTRLLDELRRAS